MRKTSKKFKPLPPKVLRPDPSVARRLIFTDLPEPALLLCPLLLLPVQRKEVPPRTPGAKQTSSRKVNSVPVSYSKNRSGLFSFVAFPGKESIPSLLDAFLLQTPQILSNACIDSPMYHIGVNRIRKHHKANDITSISAPARLTPSPQALLTSRPELSPFNHPAPPLQQPSARKTRQ